ncbi:unnamed protein product, partial [Didymodactylos carnosus]
LISVNILITVVGVLSFNAHIVHGLPPYTERGFSRLQDQNGNHCGHDVATTQPVHGAQLCDQESQCDLGTGHLITPEYIRNDPRYAGGHHMPSQRRK